MTPWWIGYALLWLVVLAYATPGAFTAAFRPAHVRFGDPMRLGVWLVAATLVLHPARFLIAHDNYDLFKAIYVLGGISAINVFRLMRVYGRGPHV